MTYPYKLIWNEPHLSFYTGTTGIAMFRLTVNTKTREKLQKILLELQSVTTLLIQLVSQYCYVPPIGYMHFHQT